MPKVKAKSHSKNIKTNRINSNSLSFLKTQIICLTVYIVAFLLGSIVSLLADLSDNSDVYISLIILGVSSFISGFIGGNKIRKNGILTGVVYALPSNIIVIVSAIISTGFMADFRLAITAVTLIITSAAGGVTAVNKRHRR